MSNPDGVPPGLLAKASEYISFLAQSGEYSDSDTGAAVVLPAGGGGVPGSAEEVVSVVAANTAGEILGKNSYACCPPPPPSMALALSRFAGTSTRPPHARGVHAHACSRARTHTHTHTHAHARPHSLLTHSHHARRLSLPPLPSDQHTVLTQNHPSTFTRTRQNTHRRDARPLHSAAQNPQEGAQGPLKPCLLPLWIPARWG